MLEEVHPRGPQRTRSAGLLSVVAAVLLLASGASPAAAEDGGVNTGLPGSTCAGVENSAALPLEPGVSTTWYGPDAPAYYEIGPPTGIFAGQHPKGIMLVIHGGGWFHTGAAHVGEARSEANRWRARGWSTVNLTYRACAESIADVLWFYDVSRVVAGPDLPVCATGMSAGGHLALMIAAQRSDMSCVVAQGAPSNLTSLLDQTAFDPSTLGQQSAGPAMVHWWAAAAFAGASLPERSPALAPIGARVLAATAERDTFIPAAQDSELAEDLRATSPTTYVDTMQLSTGSEPFTHAGISRLALESFWQHELQLVEPLVPSAPSHVLPIRMSTAENPTNGSMQLGTSVTATSVTATAGSTAIRLDRGSRYRLETCIGWFSEVAPASKCTTSAVIDARANGTDVSAPRISATYARSRSVENLAMAVVTVSRQTTAGKWVDIGTSWPASGLEGSGIPLAPVP